MPRRVFSTMGVRMRRISLLALIATTLASAAWAHGSHDDGLPQGAHSHDHGWTLNLVRRAAAAAQMEIDEAQGLRFIRADGIANHATGRFPNDGNPNSIRRQDYYFRLPLKPQKTGCVVFYRPNHLFGVAVNGVVFDPNTAEFWRNDRSSGWMIEALSGATPLGIDRNNAHVQPDGSYHYHGLPMGLLELLDYRNTMALIGWAADGFPIYGPFGYRDPRNPQSGLIELRPSWSLKAERDQPGPSGKPDGTYVLDYGWTQGSGDLDECNGRTGVTPEFPQGTYYYVVTKPFPHVPRCFMGTADASFVKRGGAHTRGGGGRPPPMGQPR
ncbi:MAG: YHYH protein [Alphaproteobacteria bacterium]|nr:YHYH protein [Alphaproteobacteria bacterium]